MNVTVCAFDELTSGSARRVMMGKVPVAVVRIDDEVFAIADTCSHADVSLSDGMVWCETKQIECIRHGSSFSLETGAPDTLPATQPVAVFQASVVDGQVVVEMKEDAQ
jgi:3-phenylpropionate/trans-cinnamate dioxygenase ferredoxin component